MKPLFKYFILLLIIIAQRAAAQPLQVAYKKEKIYLHTNHIVYAPGDGIFFKLYLVNGSDNRPSRISNVVYTEVLGPAGNVVEKQTYKTTAGYCEGAYSLPADAPGGIYKLRAYSNWMRNEHDSSFFTKQLTVQKIIAPRILMKLDFDRKGYGAGDSVRANFSMRSLDDMPIKKYTCSFTVLIAGQQATKGNFVTNMAGGAFLLFKLPVQLETTDVLLNVTVDYDLHKESISRSVPVTLNKVDLQFMPEGGTFVAGTPANIAFRSINEFGKPVDIKGIIVNTAGHEVASFESYKFGMGRLAFTPNAGEGYQAIIRQPANITQRYTLPPVALQGIVLNMAKKDKVITAKIYCGGYAGVKLIAQSKNITYYKTETTLHSGLNEITVDENLFPAGIAQFTLYTLDNMPVAERLIFLNEEKHLYIHITTDKKQYQPREKVNMLINTNDETGKPVPSNLSVSVVDDKLWTMADDKQDNISSWLLMSSELKGAIEEPKFYFKKDEPKALAALDLVMLTHGYRYFNFTKMVLDNRRLKYTPDENNIISGMVLNSNGLPVPATVFIINNVYGGKAFRQQTGDDGLFYFGGLIEKTSYTIVAQALQKQDITIKILQNGIGYNTLKTDAVKQLYIDDTFILTHSMLPAANADATTQNQPVPNGLEFKSSNLSEVVVTGYGTVLKKNLTGSVAYVYNNQLTAIPSNGLTQALEGKAAGLQINTTSLNNNTSVMIRGARTIQDNEPLYVINGVPQQALNISSINVNEVESVTILKDASATALYGSKAANGVIIITSKQYRNEKLRFSLTKKHNYYYTSIGNLVVNAPYYTLTRHFYVPLYKTTKTAQRDDYREAIYWNPVVQTGADGKAEISFYNSDATTTFRAVAEGIGYNGKPGTGDTTYSAQAALELDVKVPPYLTVADTALLPLTIKNNSPESIQATISITLPNHLAGDRFDSVIQILPGNTVKRYIPVTATAEINDSIRIKIAGAGIDDRVTLPISAGQKGFPVIQTFAGNTNKTHQFTIGAIIPGSLQAKLSLYSSLEGQLLDGIESMLREPYGCFEQTSSTTYPNILILKYLEQSGRSNAEIENKTLSYISRGYKRLIGFETSENGFEWFGHAPASEALTAYGLMEFKDMQEFIHVDNAILERAKKLLLSRRDGNGGFILKSDHGYELHEITASIINTYIVYALSQAGYGSEFEKEYKVAVEKALAGNDAYQLAMMALAADNMHNTIDYNTLLKQLANLYTTNKATTSINMAYGRGASLQVETKALYALALMRGPHPDASLIAKLVQGLLEAKQYYGYGSTQATLFALQAVTAYAKLAADMAIKNEVAFSLNSTRLDSTDSIAKLLNKGKNLFNASYKNNQPGIPYSLEVSYNIFTPPNDGATVLALQTTINNRLPAVGETVRMDITLSNTTASPQPMAIAKIGIPAGLSLQPWQLKEMVEKNEAAYYEIFDHYLVFYWLGLSPNENKTIHLDLKAEIPGSYKAKAGCAYLYYTPENKCWSEGATLQVRE